MAVEPLVVSDNAKHNEVGAMSSSLISSYVHNASGIRHEPRIFSPRLFLLLCTSPSLLCKYARLASLSRKAVTCMRHSLRNISGVVLVFMQFVTPTHESTKMRHAIQHDVRG